jgi:hypothetical protein
VQRSLAAIGGEELPPLGCVPHKARENRGVNQM